MVCFLRSIIEEEGVGRNLVVVRGNIGRSRSVGVKWHREEETSNASAGRDEGQVQIKHHLAPGIFHKVPTQRPTHPSNTSSISATSCSTKTSGQLEYGDWHPKSRCHCTML